MVQIAKSKQKMLHHTNGTLLPEESKEELHLQEITWEGLTWLNVEKPTPREIEYLSQHYPFHHLDLDDCLSRIQLPKIDVYDEYLFIVLHFPLFSKEAQVTIPSQVSIFIGRDYLVTLHAGTLKPLTKLFRDCQLREEARQENMRCSGYLLYRIVDRLIDYCLPILNKIIENMDKVEDDIFDAKKRETVKELSALRRDIISYRRIISPLRTVVATLEYHTSRFQREDMEVYWGDATDHIDKMRDTLDECKEIIEGLNDTNNSLYSHHTNEVMRILTILATVIMPLTLVASLYGMNVHLPGDYGEGYATFIIILVVMSLITGGMLFFFYRRGWI